jgi:hypothetical protein
MVTELPAGRRVISYVNGSMPMYTGVRQRSSLAVSVAALGSFLILASLSGCRTGTAPTTPEEPAGPIWFKDITESSGLRFVHDVGPTGTYFMPQVIGSGAAFLDYDNDGRLDIYLLQNGGPSSQSRNQLFHQEKDGRFTNVSAGSGLDIAGYNMGVAVGDVNNDGLVDVLVTQFGGIKLFLNQGNGTFRDVTQEAGLDNPQWGTSACFFDYDRDGWLDLVVVNYVDYNPSTKCNYADGTPDFCHPKVFGGTVTRLFHNKGRAAGTANGVPRFEDVTIKSGLGKVPGPGLGVTCADFDGDGWPDILVANDAQPNRLWINRRDGTFAEEAALRGIAYNNSGQAQGNMGIALGDLGDGLCDVFITHLTEETHTLWRQGPRGFFRDRTQAAGLASPHWRGTGFGTVLGDFDHDGHLDLAVVNGRVSRGKPAASSSPALFWQPYAERNQLFANDGQGRFRDISRANAPFCERPGVYRGLVCGDVDGDGALDLLVTAVGGPARLYRNVAPNRGHWLMVRAVDAVCRRDAYGAQITVVAGQRRWVSWINPGQSYLSSHDPRAHFGLGSVDMIDSIVLLWPDGTEETFPGTNVDRVLLLEKGQGKRKASP